MGFLAEFKYSTVSTCISEMKFCRKNTSDMDPHMNFEFKCP